MTDLHSVQLEAQALAGLMKHTDIFFEICNWVIEEDFANKVHKSIYSLLEQRISTNATVNSTLLAQDIKNLGINFKDKIDIHPYIESLSRIKVSRPDSIQTFKKLVDLRARRGLVTQLKGQIEYVENSLSEPINDVVSNVDAMYSKEIKGLFNPEEPVNIFEVMESQIEERGNNPIEDIGLITPHTNFNGLYGGLVTKNITAIVSRPGQGKTTWLVDIAFKTAKLDNFDTYCLYLDTEMETSDIVSRTCAALSKADEWYTRTGKWRTRQDYTKQVRALWPQIKGFKFFHHKIGNKPAEYIANFVRRWYYKHVKNKVGSNGKPIKFLLIYDYIKLTGEKVSAAWQEHQAIGEKVDKLKKLGEEFDCAVLTANQQNRSGDSYGKKAGQFADDSTSIAQSDRLLWFGGNIGIYREKTIEELTEDGPDWGNYVYINVKKRFHGKDNIGRDLVNRVMSNGETRTFPNCIFFNVKNFNVEEVGTLRDLVDAQNNVLQIQDDPTPDPLGDL